MKRVMALCATGLLLVLLVGVGGIGVAPVQACSGGVYTTVGELVTNSDIVVHGRVVELDDTRQNAVMRVVSYLKGTPPSTEYILLSLTTPAFINMNTERRRSGGCFYGVNPLPSETDIVIFLVRNRDGSYTFTPHSIGEYFYPFPEHDSTVGVALDEESRVIEQLSLTQMINYIQETSNTVAFNPSYQGEYPLLAPLLLTTDAGTRYLLPVDYSDPVAVDLNEPIYAPRRYQSACWQINCTGFSPNGIDSAQTLPDHAIRITGRWSVPGDVFIFSSTSDAIAIWRMLPDESAQLTIYVLDYPRLQGEQGAIIQQLHQRDIAVGSLTTDLGGWSPDGRIFAFADSGSVWFWDIFTPDAEPVLFTDVNAAIAEFSPTGRYLSLYDDVAGLSIDTVNRQILPPGLFSPDDRLLITRERPFRLLHLTPYGVALNGERFTDKALQYALWANTNDYYLVVCDNPQQRATCEVISSYAWSGVTNHFDGYAIDYEPTFRELVIVQDANTLYFYPTSAHPNRRIFSLNVSSFVDSDIAAIEWLPSLFYTQ